MYGIGSSCSASNRRSSQRSRMRAGTSIPAMTGTSASIARFTAVPIAPDELSTCSSAGESFSSKDTAPSAATTGSLRATCRISVMASFRRWTGSADFQPKAPRRNRAGKVHL